MENVTVIICLSVDPAMGTDLQPFFADVLYQPGTNFGGVWSRLMIIEDGILCSLIFCTIPYKQTVSISAFNFSEISPFPVVASLQT